MRIAGVARMQYLEKSDTARAGDRALKTSDGLSTSSSLAPAANPAMSSTTDVRTRTFLTKQRPTRFTTKRNSKRTAVLVNALLRAFFGQNSPGLTSTRWKKRLPEALASLRCATGFRLWQTIFFQTTIRRFQPTLCRNRKNREPEAFDMKGSAECRLERLAHSNARFTDT